MENHPAPADGVRVSNRRIMKIRLFQFDAFAEQVFTGNPAAVCPLERWLDDATLQAIAGECS
jgi:predicted PhzF superfamily epimerase YddE/YHI9